MTDEEDKKIAEEAIKKDKAKEAASADDDPQDRTSSKGKDEETPDAIEEAKKAAKELREANEERKKILEREEKIEAERIASGRGQTVQKTEPEPMSDREYSKALMRGEIPKRD